MLKSNINNRENISISMYINKSDNFRNKTLPFKNILEKDNKTVYRWTPDSSVNKCYDCKIEFSIINRKHHCRNCGKIFCSKCSDNWIDIPKFVNSVDKENIYWSYATYINYFKLTNQKERTCNSCFLKILELKDLFLTMDIFNLLSLDILDYLKISLVCKSWNKVSNYYFAFLREIQYYLPDNKYTNKEINILKNNRYYFTEHSKWITHLILIKDLAKIKAEDILDIIHSKKKYNCWSMSCSRNCYKEIQPEDVIICLYNTVSDIKILDYLIMRLNTSVDSELLCYVPFIVYQLRYYKENKNIINLFINFLLERSKISKNFCNILFWELTQLTKDVQNYQFYSEIRKNLVNSLDSETYKLFVNGYDFTNNIVEILNGSNNIKEDLMKHLKNNQYSKEGEFYLPIDINKKFYGIETEKIKIINSKTKPIILPCIYNDGTKKSIYNIMIKNEDIRKEYIIMNVIKLMDYFLKKDEKLDLNIIKYNILPIGNNYGYIEFVNNSYTLYGIKEEYFFSIQNFIIEKNPKITAEVLRDNFTKSCAAYCVISYLLGIGDRHLDNIMITSDANIFNIDFGYILGNDPKLLAPEFRLTSGMIDAMGGIHSKYYSDFKNYCGKAYNCLRRHASIFFVQLSLLYSLNPSLTDLNLNKEYVKKQLINRFIPWESYEDAEFQFNYKIETNSNSYSGNIIDYFHKKVKNSNSSSDSLNEQETIYESAKNVFNATSNLTSNVKNGIKNLIYH